MEISEVSELLKLSRERLGNMRYAGTGPVFVKMGGRDVRYWLSDVLDWLQEGRRLSTAPQDKVALPYRP